MRGFIAVLVASSLYLSGCTLIAVTDAAVSTTVGVAKGTVNAAGTVVDVVVPDGGND